MFDEKNAFFEKMDLLYKDTHITTELVEQPTAQLNLQAFLNGDASCWEQSGEQASSKKKAIIVTSWLLAYPETQDESNAYFETFIFLMREGFSLYFPMEHGLEKLTPPSTPNETKQRCKQLNLFLEEFMFINDIDALARAQEIGLTRDRMLILSSQRLIALTLSLIENKKINASIPTDHYFVSNDMKPIKLDNAMDCLTLDELEQRQNTDDRYFFSCVSPLSKIPTTILNKIDSLSFKKIEQLIDDDKDFIPELKSLSTLIFSNNERFNLEYFKQFLAFFPDTRQITRLYFQATDITITDLNLLLKCIPNLLHLTIDPSCRIQQTTPASTLFLPESLQTFELPPDNAETQDVDTLKLSNIRNTSSELNELSLGLEDDAYQFICQSNLSKLKRLSLSIGSYPDNSRGAADFLFKLEAAENLQHLSLIADNIFQEGNTPRPFKKSFKALKSLYLKIEDKINTEDLSCLLNAAQSLETLDLDINDMTPNNQVVLLEELPELKKVSINFCDGLHYHNSTNCFIFKLLNAAPNITHLTIKDLNRDFNANQKPIKLGELKSLTFDGIANIAHINHYLEVLTNNSPEFETLRVINPIFVDGNQNEEYPYSLDSLKRLDIRNINDYDVLDKLIDLVDHAPNLETIVVPKEYIAKDFREVVNPNIKIFNYNSQDSDEEPSVPELNTNETLALDGDITMSDTPIHAQDLFKAVGGLPAPEPRSYHLNLYKWHISDTNTPLQRYKPIEQNLIAVNVDQGIAAENIIAQFESLNEQEHSSYYYGQYTYQDIEANRWYQLPALGTDDVLIAVSALSGNEPYELKRDIKTGYYFIKFNQIIVELTLNFIIHSQPVIYFSPAIDDTQLSEPENILRNLRFKDDGDLDKTGDAYNNLIAYLSHPEQTPQSLVHPLIRLCSFNQAYGEQPINEQLPGRLLNALLDRREGACRHRANLFAALASALGLEAMVVYNPVHQFGMFFDKQESTNYSIDFGGSDATVEIEPMASLDSKQEKTLFDVKNNPFQTWNTLSLKAKNAKELAEELNHPSAPGRQLVIVNSDQDIKALHEGMLVSHDGSRCFFSKDLDSLELETPCLNEGIFQKIDSPLAQFLKHAQAYPDRLYHWYINWSDPKPKHVAYNSIIDDHERNLKGLAVAGNVHIIVVCDQFSSTRLGEDVYSRMDAICQAKHINLQARSRKNIKKQIWDETAVLLTKHEDWKQLLLGRFNIEGQHFSLEEGALIKAIRKETSIRIYNPPWDDRDFSWFISELEGRGGFYFNGQWYVMPTDFKLEFAQAKLNLPSLPLGFERGENLLILNQDSFTFFFKHYLINQNGQIASSPGYIANTENGQIDVMVTETLSEEQWFQLFKSAAQYNVALSFTRSNLLKLPDNLQRAMSPVTIEELNPAPNVSVILSNDLDFAASQFEADVSISIDLKNNADSLFFHVSRQENSFHAEETDLLQALRNGEDVLIKGHFSKAMERRFESLFTSYPALYVNGEWIAVTGSIILITEDSNIFHQLEKININYDASTDLEQFPPDIAEHLMKHYQALGITPRHSHFLHYPTSADEQLQWVNELVDGLYLSAGVMTEPRPATHAQEVLDYLTRHPFVFLCSESGEGKSYFVHHVLRAYAQDLGLTISIYNGLEKLKDWASQQGTEAVLFIDEANLLAEHFMLFDSFAKGERELWIEGKLYLLTEQHYLIFAGNPNQYEGRFEADLFKRFPYFLQFHKQGLQNILEPLLFFIDNADEKQTFLHLINTYYQKGKEAGLQMTARNAQMICLRYFILNHQFFHDLMFQVSLSGTVNNAMSPVMLQLFAILSELEYISMDKKETKAIRQELKDQMNWKENKYDFNCWNEVYEQLSQKPEHDFVLTPSRQKTKRAMETFLRIRQLKLEGHVSQNSGINGILFEGEPGLGKSQLCITLLKEYEINYTYLAQGDYQRTRELVLEAFHQGQGVIVDEFSSFADEELWNAVLSGYDLDGQPARQAGFFVFATQNPTSLPGRKPLSPALMNRMMLIKLNHYSEPELLSILELKHKLPPQTATKLTRDYLEAREHSNKLRLFPQPNPRTFFSKAQEQNDPDDAESMKP